MSNGEKVDSRIYPELQEMFDDARAQGYGLFVAAGYRTAEKQQQLTTGVINEPWHYRYVGKTAAQEIYSQGICLEEYIEKRNNEK